MGNSPKLLVSFFNNASWLVKQRVTSLFQVDMILFDHCQVQKI